MEKNCSIKLQIVTGAAVRVFVGAGVSKALRLTSGATVILNHPVAATKDAAEAVLNEIKEAGGDGITCQCDVSKEEEVIRDVCQMW